MAHVPVTSGAGERDAAAQPSPCAPRSAGARKTRAAGSEKRIGTRMSTSCAPPGCKGRSAAVADHRFDITKDARYGVLACSRERCDPGASHGAGHGAHRVAEVERPAGGAVVALGDDA